MAGRTQAALYAEIDLELSWSEEELPQVERTKHVHALHPYLGKFVPQLVEIFLRRYFAPGDCVYDPFRGSGTTLVEANAFGCRRGRLRHLGVQLPAQPGQDGAYPLGELELALRGALEAARRAAAGAARGDARDGSSVVRTARARRAPRLPRRPARLGRPARDVAPVILSRAARSARLTTHFDLDFPAAPGDEPVLVPQAQARVPAGARRRRSSCAATRTTRSRRIRAFAAVRTARRVEVLHDDARTVGLPRAGRRGLHLAALPRPHRLPRAAPLRVRAARPRRPARGGDRRRRAAGRRAARSSAYVEAMTACSRTRAASSRPARPS